MSEIKEKTEQKSTTQEQKSFHETFNGKQFCENYANFEIRISISKPAQMTICINVLFRCHFTKKIKTLRNQLTHCDKSQFNVQKIRNIAIIKCKQKVA